MYPKTFLENMRKNGPIESRKFNNIQYDQAHDLYQIRVALNDIAGRMVNLHQGKAFEALATSAANWIKEAKYVPHLEG